MADRSLIECTDATWNPVTGCTKVSPGCKHCYAERHWTRLRGNRGTIYYGRSFTDIQTHPERLDQPQRWRKPRLIFVNSMSDLFHPEVPFEFIHSMWRHMAASHQHIYQILTKRVERAAQFFAWNDRLPASERLRPHCKHIWFGASVEDQETADDRIPQLLRLPVAVRWICVEPMLAPVDLSPWLGLTTSAAGAGGESRCQHCRWDNAGARPASAAIHWLVVGGESGPRARACHVNWIADTLRECRKAGIAAFVRHLGSAAHWDHAGETCLMPKSSRKIGSVAHWPAPLQMQAYPDLDAL